MTTRSVASAHTAPTPPMAPSVTGASRRRPANVRIAFASGANAAGEILGFAAAGIAPGVAAPELRGTAMTALHQLSGTGVPVFVDSGAFSEVTFGPEGRQVVAPITDAEWRQRLTLYRELASSLGAQLTCVAPDAVGDQDETLIRLATYRPEIQALVEAGARVLVPVQKGARSQVAFWAACLEIVGDGVIPALPMKKAATTPEEAVRFLRTVQPRDVHLLGFGLKNRGALPFLTMVAEVAPMTSVTLDANLITAAVGRDAEGMASRGLTAAQDAIRASTVGANDTCMAAAWGLCLDYTDLASWPSAWTTASERRQIAQWAQLAPSDTTAFVTTPDAFLQGLVLCTAQGRITDPGRRAVTDLWAMPEATVDDEAAEERLRWYEEPLMECALAQAYQTFLQDAVVQPRKALAITRAFASHPAADQFPAPPTLRDALEEALALFADLDEADATAFTALLAGDADGTARPRAMPPHAAGPTARRRGRRRAVPTDTVPLLTATAPVRTGTQLGLGF